MAFYPLLVMPMSMLTSTRSSDWRQFITRSHPLDMGFFFSVFLGRSRTTQSIIQWIFLMFWWRMG
jgi:hypothetical protein